MTNENARYRPGALWKTRTKLKADAAYEPLAKEITISRGELIMLVEYSMDFSYEEHIMFLWNEQVYCAFYIDSGFGFDTDPDGVNTKKQIDYLKK